MQSNRYIRMRINTFMLWRRRRRRRQTDIAFKIAEQVYFEASVKYCSIRKKWGRYYGSFAVSAHCFMGVRMVRYPFRDLTV